jgi:hypothetical protein
MNNKSNRFTFGTKIIAKNIGGVFSLVIIFSSLIIIVGTKQFTRLGYQVTHLLRTALPYPFPSLGF